MKFSDTKGHERVSADPQGRERRQKSQVLPWWEHSQGFLTQKWNNKKTSYWLTLRKSWACWGKGGILINEWNGPVNRFVKGVVGGTQRRPP